MITIDRLKEIVDEHFRSPFISKHFVRTHFPECKPGQKRVLAIKIGRRDIWIDEDGNVEASGTDIEGLSSHTQEQIQEATQQQFQMMQAPRENDPDESLLLRIAEGR
jgi:hypothetical protein